MQNDDFKRALEAIKLRAPIEDVVRERVPGLRKAGAIWKACCPFHEERTPSFTVTPARDRWHCFGSCSTGGDQFRFLERFDNISFMDAVEILAARTGVELPRRRGQARDGEEASALHSALESATRFYRAQLRTAEGQAAARYLRERGLTENTAEAFGVGYAPAHGNAFVSTARAERLDLGTCEKAGLVRRNAEGNHYDFFRGRLMIPIRDDKGRTVGFGARRLSDAEEAGPKYVNTAETELFHKGRLVYALDRALPQVRKLAHIVLVEGYTDVMAAHQCGVANVVAVLGTATTEEHAGLIRKTGARRVSLVFDGDEAGRKAAYKALHGLLPLEVELDVVSLSGGDDPCDLLVREGSSAFLAQLELAQGWFDFLVDGLRQKTGMELSREVDRVLELLSRLSKPVHRDSRIAELAKRLELPMRGVQQQYDQLPGVQAQRRQAAPVRAAVAQPRAQPAAAPDPVLVAAFVEMLDAVLRDASTFPMVQPLVERCPDPELARIFAAIAALYADMDATIDEASVIAILRDDVARDRVCTITEQSRKRDRDIDPVDRMPMRMVELQISFLERRAREERSREERRNLSEREAQVMRESGEERAGRDPALIEDARHLFMGSQAAHPVQFHPTQVQDSNHHG